MNQDKQKFIDKYKEIAIQQQLKYGIPASITLAQAILESSYGTSKQAKECKNFFGVKKEKVGKEIQKTILMIIPKLNLFANIQTQNKVLKIILRY